MIRTFGSSGEYRLGANSLLGVRDSPSLVQVNGPLTVAGALSILNGADVAADLVRITPGGRSVCPAAC
ncbi:hypothetical protein [Lacipirellula limnantheis]|uniref:Uncharacterized protein n=1 Tax=Lacipirellula limnantheis TaxID=2528024 RepID=A0A517TY15_9BACT|nr:hypothetical protein [Lacipirellula limnantheis]QDT73260.1 hypothetical protein I41_24490 [Lacipirellula limnantheis]